MELSRLGRITIMLCLGGIAGCAAPQAANNQDVIRCKLLELYTNQLMDNLARAHSGLPIVHVDYQNLFTQVTVEGSTSIGGGQDLTDTKTYSGIGLLTGVTRAFKSAFTYGVAGKNTDQVSLRGDPLVNNNDVYLAYLSFLKEPGNLLVTDEPPPAGAAHVCTCFCKRHYWVPIDRREQFFNLSLATTVMRGQPLRVRKDFDVAIDYLLTSEDLGTRRPTTLALFRLEPGSKLPNAEGRVSVVVKGELKQLSVSSITSQDFEDLKIAEKVIEAKIPELGAQSNLLLIRFSVAEDRITIADLAKDAKQQKVTVRLPGFIPEPPPVEAMVKEILGETSIIRANSLPR